MSTTAARPAIVAQLAGAYILLGALPLLIGGMLLIARDGAGSMFGWLAACEGLVILGASIGVLASINAARVLLLWIASLGVAAFVYLTFTSKGAFLSGSITGWENVTFMSGTVGLLWRTAGLVIHMLTMWHLSGPGAMAHYQEQPAH